MPRHGDLVRCVDASNRERIAIAAENSPPGAPLRVYVMNLQTLSQLPTVQLPHASVAGGAPYWAGDGDDQFTIRPDA